MYSKVLVFAVKVCRFLSDRARLSSDNEIIWC